MVRTIDQLQAAYRGEIRGEAFFRRWAVLTSDPAARCKLLLLARLEHETGKRLLELLQQLGVPVDDEPAQITQGQLRAAEWQSLGWLDGMRRLETLVEPYLDLYDRMAEEAGPVEQETLDVLARHEHALYTFAQHEQEGRSTEALRALTSLLAAPPLRAGERCADH